MNDSLQRLFRMAAIYRGRLTWAVAAMLVYAAASAGLAALIRPILDSVLPSQTRLAQTAWAIVGLYLLKGVGSYASSYLMADVGQRVVMDLRNRLFDHILGQSASFFAHRTTGQLMSRITNDVGQVQQAVSETVGDLARESLSIVGLAGLLFYYDARLAIFCMASAPLVVYPLVRLGQRVRRTTHRSQEALESISHISAEAFTGHRIVKAFGSEREEGGKFAPRRLAAVPHEHEGHGRAGEPAAVHGSARRRRHGSGDLVWQRADRVRAAHHRRIHVVRGRAAHDVWSGEETEPREREPPADDGRDRAHLRDARHAHRGARAARRRAARAVPVGDRVPRRGVRLRGQPRAHPARRVLHRPLPGRWWRLWAAAAPARRRW